MIWISPLPLKVLHQALGFFGSYILMKLNLWTQSAGEQQYIKLDVFTGPWKLSPWLLSDMRMTHVAALVSHLDIETYGFKEALTAIKNDFITFEKSILIKTKSEKPFNYAVKRLSFVADNLAYHAIFGFKKNFLAVPAAKNRRYSNNCSRLFLRNVCWTSECQNHAMKMLLRRETEFEIFAFETENFDPYELFNYELHHDIFQGS